MNTYFNSKHPGKKSVGILLVLVILLILTTSLANASHSGPVITVTRLGGTMVGIKIVFPEGISGSFAGVINHKHFDCDTIPPDTLYCIGPLPYWVDGATLHIYGTPGGDVVLTHFLNSPPKPGEPDAPAPPATEEPPQCVECDS